MDGAKSEKPPDPLGKQALYRVPAVPGRAGDTLPRVTSDSPDSLPVGRQALYSGASSATDGGVTGRHGAGHCGAGARGPVPAEPEKAEKPERRQYREPGGRRERAVYGAVPAMSAGLARRPAKPPHLPVAHRRVAAARSVRSPHDVSFVPQTIVVQRHLASRAEAIARSGVGLGMFGGMGGSGSTFSNVRVGALAVFVVLGLALHRTVRPTTHCMRCISSLLPP